MRRGSGQGLEANKITGAKNLPECVSSKAVISSGHLIVKQGLNVAYSSSRVVLT